MANKAKRKIETVEYIVFDKNNIAEAEEFTKSKITFSKKFSSKEFDVFVIDSGIDQKHIHNFDIITKDEKGVINIWEYTTFIKFFEKFDPDAIDKALEEHPEIQAPIADAVKDYENEIRAEREFYLIPELESVIRFFEESQSTRLSETAEQEQARNEKGIEALYNFCRGLVIGAKIARH